MGLSTATTLFIITGCIGGLALILGLLYAYLYFTKMRPKDENPDKRPPRPLPGRPSKMVHAGKVPIRVPLTDGEIELQKQNPDIFKGWNTMKPLA